MKKDLSIEILKKCPNLCLHCSSCSDMNAEQIIEYEKICELVDGSVKLDVKRICLSGGEPFLHPDVLKIIAYIKNKDIEVNVYTCGVITKDGLPVGLSKELLGEAKKLGLTKLMFNLQSVNENTYDKIVGVAGNFPKVKESIKRAMECGINSEIHFVPMKMNHLEINDVIDFAVQNGIECVSFLKLVPHGRATNNKDKILLDEKELEFVKNTLYEQKLKGKPIRIGIPLSKSQESEKCHAIHGKLYVKYNGDVFGCEAFKYLDLPNTSDGIKPDNIYDKDIVEIYYSSLFLKCSRELIKDYNREISNCETCPVQKYIRKEGNQNVKHY